MAPFVGSTGGVRVALAEPCGYHGHMSASPTSRTVGSRELKTRLGTYLRQVREGAHLIVTDRGRPVAELRPLTPGGDQLEQRLHELVALGMLSGTVGDGVALADFDPVESTGPPLSDAIVEDREDRF